MSDKILCMDKKAWWIIEIIFLLTIIAFELATLGVKKWFNQGESPFDWEGGLLWPTEDSKYHSHDYTYYHIYENCDPVMYSEGSCKGFRRLWAGGCVYVLFECFSLLFLVLTIGVLIANLLTKKVAIWLSLTFYWNAVMWQFLGFVIWGGLSKVTYKKGNCDDNNWNGGADQANVCAHQGAKLALFTVLYIFVCCAFFNIIYLIGRKKKDDELQGIDRLPAFKDNKENLLPDEGKTRKKKKKKIQEPEQ